MKKKEIKDTVIDMKNDKLKATPKIKSKFNTINKILRFFEKLKISIIYSLLVHVMFFITVNDLICNIFLLTLFKKRS